MRPSTLFFNDVRVVVTTRDDGDQRPEPQHASFPTALPTRLAERCTYVHQVHGSRVVVVHRALGPLDIEADAIVTTEPNVPIGVLGADCSLIGLASQEGVIGVVHSGWRGLLSGVIEQTVEQMRAAGARSIEAVIGPTIGPECYEFSASDLVPLVDRFGEEVQVRRDDGSDALDLVRGVTAALEMAGVANPVRLGGCTACDPNFYSWRAHKDQERHSLMIWRDLASESART